MWVGESPRLPVDGQHETTVARHRVDGEARDHTLPLVADPMPGQVAGQPDEAGPVLGCEVCENGAVKDDESGIVGYLCDQSRQRLEEISPHHARRIASRDGYGASQAFSTLLLPRPDQGLQPGAGILIGDVDGRQIDAGPPGHLRQRGRRSDTRAETPRTSRRAKRR